MAFQRFQFSFLILLLLLVTCDNSKSSKLQCTKLRCEYLQSPLGIDVENPRFSWIIKGMENNVLQKAWQIKVMKNNKEIIWDSKKIYSSETTNIEYRGKTLKSHQNYTWQVKIWDHKNNESTWSEKAVFHTAFLTDDSFSGSWIKNPNKKIRSPFFRKDFDIPGKIKSSIVYATSIGLFEMHLNGKKVNDHFFEPNTTQFTERLLYTTYDVSQQLKQGNNAIGLWLGEGQSAYSAPPKGRFTNNNMRVPVFDRPMALLQLHIVLENGNKIIIVSDETWKTSSSPLTFNNYYGGEDYDARQEKKNWCLPGYDISNWENVEIGEYKGKLSSQLLPPVKINQTFEAIDSFRRDEFTIDYDCGTTVGGFWEIEVEGEAGEEIIVRGSEKCGGGFSQRKLSADNKLNWSDNHTGKYYYKNCYSRYILKGKGTERYQPRFFYHGFRYLQVKVSNPEKIRIKSIRVHQLQNSIKETGRFECSNERLNQIHNITVQTFRNNLLHGIPLSNTNSEKYGWTGDVHLFSEAASFSFETASFWTKWLNDFPDNQKWSGNDGRIAVVIPELRDKKAFVNDVSWLSVYPQLLEEMLKSNHDKQIVKKHFPSLKEWYEYVYNHTDNGIASGVWGDHKIPGENKTSLGATRTMARLINTSYFYNVSIIMAELAQAIDEESSNYLLNAEKIKTVFHKEFYLPKNDYFMENRSPENFNYELAANLIALHCGIVADSLTGRISEFVQSQITNNNYRVPTGILGTKAYIDWFQKKDVDMLYKIIKQKDFPGYMYLLDLGATTLNQDWTGAGDYNHCMLGCVNEFFYNNLLGIQPDIKNRKIIIEPFIPDDMSFANGKIQTIYGEVSVNWKKEGNKLILNAEIPANTKAVFKMPITINSRITVNGEESAGTFETGSGKYVISINLTRIIH